MARPASRISNVVMPGPLAPFAERYRLELLARLYRAFGGERVPSGRLPEPLA